MAKHRIKKYSRRRSQSPYKKSVAPIIISVIAFLVLSLVVSVVIGILLGRRTDGVGSETKFDFERVDYDSNGKTVRAVEAYNFPKGASPYDYVRQEISDLSVCVSHKDGSLAYAFDVAEKTPVRENGEGSFKSLCASSKDAGARVCAYLYVTSFKCEDSYEREIVKAFEIALIKEIAQSGANDILLLGIEVDESNISEVENFVAKAALAAGKIQIGVAVSEEILALTENEVYLAARIRSCCDYLALDLTSLTVEDGESQGKNDAGEDLPSKLEETLEKNKYYIKSYPMRLLFSQEEFKIYAPALALGVEDLQIVGE